MNPEKLYTRADGEEVFGSEMNMGSEEERKRALDEQYKRDHAQSLWLLGKGPKPEGAVAFGNMDTEGQGEIVPDNIENKNNVIEFPAPKKSEESETQQEKKAA